MRALYRFYTGRVRVLGYWLVRAALLMCVILALWVVGWKHWTVVLGALFLSEVIAYSSFGSQHDLLLKWVGRRMDGQFPPREGRDPKKA